MKRTAIIALLLLVLALALSPAQASECAECNTPGDCPPGMLCRESECRECLEHTDCPKGYTCAEGLCLRFGISNASGLGYKLFMPGVYR